MLNNEALPDVFVHGVSVKMATAVWMVTEPIMQLFGWLTAGYGFCVLPFSQELKDENWMCWVNSGFGLIQIWYCTWILLLNYFKCIWIYSWVINVYVCIWVLMLLWNDTFSPGSPEICFATGNFVSAKIGITSWQSQIFRIFSTIAHN